MRAGAPRIESEQYKPFLPPIPGRCIVHRSALAGIFFERTPCLPTWAVLAQPGGRFALRTFPRTVLNPESEVCCAIRRHGRLRKSKVLLVGECANPHCNIAQRLARWDADCCFASSSEEVCELLTQETFDLIISDTTLTNGTAWRVVPLLEGSSSTLFCSHPIEDSCLWIKVVDRGQVCWGAPALRPREFGRLLKRMLNGENSLST